jgi:hypothetical protein
MVALPNLLCSRWCFAGSPVMDPSCCPGAAALVQSMQHPQEFSAILLADALYYAVFIAVDGLAAVFGFLLERIEGLTPLIWLPLQRFCIAS